MSDCCSECGNLFATPEVTEDMVKGGTLELERTRSSLAESAKYGCELCRALLAFDMRAEQARPPFKGRRSAAMYEVMLKTHPQERVRFEFRLELTRTWSILVRRTDNAFAGILALDIKSQSECKVFFFVGLKIFIRGSYMLGHERNRRDRGSVETFAFAKENMNHCNESHSCINQAFSLPTRVLDVSGDHLLLREPPKGQPAPYAALSYCCKLESKKSLILLLIHHLNLKNYAQHYRLQKHSDEVYTDFRCSGGQSQPVVTTTKNLNDFKSSISYSELPKSLQEAITTTRNLGLQYLWIDSLCIIQECFLAPRLLVFGQSCVIWKCERGDQSTTGRYNMDWNRYCSLAGLTSIRLGSGGRVFRPVQTTSTVNNFASIFNDSRAERVPEIFRVWKLMVKDYSSRHLSDSRDKLPALSGIVTYFAHAMEDDYLAGLWRKHLSYDLSWMSRDAARPLLWRCPSWSWMSVDGPIAFQGDRIEWFEPMVDILGCVVEPVDEAARFGHVKSGYLNIRGYLRRNEEVVEGKLAFGQYPGDESLFGNIVMDSQYENPEQLTGEGASGSLHLAEHGAHWCLLYATCADPRELNTVEEWVWGIALAKKLWTSGDVFQRVGYFIGNRDCLHWFTRAGLEKRTITIL